MAEIGSTIARKESYGAHREQRLATFKSTCYELADLRVNAGSPRLDRLLLCARHSFFSLRPRCRRNLGHDVLESD